MIATRRGAAVLAAITAVLGGVLVVDVARDRGPVDRALLPRFDEAKVAHLGWTASPGAIASTTSVGRAATPAAANWSIDRGEDGVWRRVQPAGELDQAKVRAVLAALRGARWQRRADRAAAGSTPHALTVDGTTIFLGASPVGEQQWVAIGDTAYLLDAWVVRALTPPPIDLAITRPLAAVTGAPTITLAELRLEGFPRRLVAPELLLDAAFVRDLEETLDLEIVALPRTVPTEAGLAISLAGTRATLSSTCPDNAALAYLATPSGGGCVRKDRADHLHALVAQLRAASPAQLIARAIAPVEVSQVTLADGSTLDLTKQPRLTRPDGTTVAADLDKVTELRAILARPRAVLPAPDALTPLATLEIRSGAARIPLAVFPLVDGGVAVRRGSEPATLRLDGTEATILRRGANELRDLALWLEDPTTITQITIGEARLVRGATLGEWTGTRAPERAEALATALAAPRARAVGPAPRPPLTRVTLTVTPPAGAPVEHTLLLGAGCAALADAQPVVLPPAICDAVARAR